MKFFLLVFWILIVAGCAKDGNSNSNASTCYQCVDQLGNELGAYCGNTVEEAFDKSGLVSGKHELDNFKKWCPTGPKYCWKVSYPVGNDIYVSNESEGFMALFFEGGIKTKIDCPIPCEQWYTRDIFYAKAIDKSSYSSVETERYCGAARDTLFEGKKVITRETVDSTYYHEFLNKY